MSDPTENFPENSPFPYGIQEMKSATPEGCFQLMNAVMGVAEALSSEESGDGRPILRIFGESIYNDDKVELTAFIIDPMSCRKIAFQLLTMLLTTENLRDLHTMFETLFNEQVEKGQLPIFIEQFKDMIFSAEEVANLPESFYGAR